MLKDYLNIVFKGVLILLILLLVVKILSVVYWIFLQNMVGNMGFYVYQQIYLLYGIGMIFVLNGFLNFIFKLVVEQLDEMSKLLIVWWVFYILFGLLLVVFFGLQFGVMWIVVYMGDVNLVLIISVVVWMFVFMLWLVIGCGYY